VDEYALRSAFAQAQGGSDRRLREALFSLVIGYDSVNARRFQIAFQELDCEVER